MDLRLETNLFVNAGTAQGRWGYSTLHIVPHVSSKVKASIDVSTMCLFVKEFSFPLSLILTEHIYTGKWREWTKQQWKLELPER